jgi:xanthine dehydrogenase YagT iron-sulfur-binding subunit
LTVWLAVRINCLLIRRTIIVFKDLKGLLMKKPMIESQSHTGLSRRSFVNSVATGAAEAAVLTLPGAAAQPGTKPTQDGEMVAVVLRINGRTHSMNVEPRWTLQYVLRDRLGLMATKDGCGRGECGACTVLIDGISRYSCLTLAVEAAGCEITTAEGLMNGEQLGTVQKAFLEEDAFQCGYCAGIALPDRS